MDTVKKNGPSCQNLHGRHSRHAQDRDRRMRSFRLALRMKRKGLLVAGMLGRTNVYLRGCVNTYSRNLLGRIMQFRVGHSDTLQSGALRDRVADCAQASFALLFC